MTTNSNDTHGNAGKLPEWPPANGVPDKRRMIPPKDLEWGQTPFDNLSRAELLRLVQAYHMALTSCGSVLHMMRHASGPSGYWGLNGAGGRALSKVGVLMDLAGDGGMNKDSEKIYRNFFRMAQSLLFPGIPDEFSQWGVNEKGEWCAPFRAGDGYRAVQWRDLLPIPKSSETQEPTP